jgi:hypothetical protein
MAMYRKRRKLVNEFFGIYTVEEESTNTMLTYIRLFPIQLSYGRNTKIFYYEIAINFLGIELALSVGEW